MSTHARIAPSILSADFSILGDEVRAAEAGGADIVHVDVMDGHFVPNITIGPLVVASLRPVTKLELDVHLMIDSPWDYLEEFARAGADSITVHIEACPDPEDTIEKIHALGKRAGITMRPGTPLASIEKVVSQVERVLIMSVEPGFGGQSFLPDQLDKARQLVEWRKQHGYKYDIQIDGGIKAHNARECAAAGIEVFVAGSAVFNGDDYGTTISAIREAANS
ncbi:MAG: ribulose-phosphate 3-epimerase [Deltaproteobacteria bacterium]